VHNRDYRGRRGRPLDYRFLQANAAFERQTGISEPVDRTARELVPDHEQHWFDTFGRILRTGTAERFEDRADALGRWYEVFATPFGDPGDRQLAVLFRDVLERKQTQTQLAQKAQQLAAIFETAPVGIALSDAAGTLILANAEAQRLFVSGRLPSVDPVGNPGWKAVDQDGSPIATADYPGIRALQGFSTLPGMEFIHTDAQGGERWTTVACVPLRDGEGSVTGAVTVVNDIDELKRSQQALRASERRLQRLLIELQYRARNILAVTRAVFSRTVEAGGDMDSIAEHFRGRLDHLARTQISAALSPDGLADLEDLVREELLSVGVADCENVSIAGPAVGLSERLAEAIGLAIHELTTNALKFGALRFPGARLQIEWSINPADCGGFSLDLAWSEQGVPAIDCTPARRGFGSGLIEDALPYRLGMKTSLQFRAGGVYCLLSVPAVASAGTATWKEM